MHLLRAMAGLLGLFACLAPASAQQLAPDSGSFRIFIGERSVGTEDFTVRTTGVGPDAEVMAVGRVALESPTGSLALDIRLHARGSEAAPTSYQVSVSGDQFMRIVTTIGNGRVSAKVITPGGEQLREYAAGAGAVVLDESVAHHYQFLAARSRSGRVLVIVPRENRQMLATVANRGEEGVALGDEQARLTHLVIQLPGSDERHVWIDALGRVMRVDIPARAYSAVRMAMPR